VAAAAAAVAGVLPGSLTRLCWCWICRAGGRTRDAWRGCVNLSASAIAGVGAGAGVRVCGSMSGLVGGEAGGHGCVSGGFG
jgi:hypothetical protein